MQVGMMRVELMIHGAHSLKEKRRPLKSLIEKTRNKYNVSVAEVDNHDLHQRATLGIAIVAVDGGNLLDQMRTVKEFIYTNPECQVLDIMEERIGAF
jgi:Uncharacterized protein conserved in bacteria